MLFMVIPTFAATSNDVITALENGVTLSTGEKIYPSVTNITAARNYLASASLSSSELDSILADINTVKTEATTSASFDELSKKATVISAVNNAAKVAKLNISIKDGSAIITDNSGITIVTVGNSSFVIGTKPDYSSVSGSGLATSDAIKQTGGVSDFNNAIIIVTVFSIILAFAGYAVYKFKLIRE